MGGGRNRDCVATAIYCWLSSLRFRAVIILQSAVVIDAPDVQCREAKLQQDERVRASVNSPDGPQHIASGGTARNLRFVSTSASTQPSTPKQRSPPLQATERGRSNRKSLRFHAATPGPDRSDPVQTSKLALQVIDSSVHRSRTRQFSSPRRRFPEFSHHHPCHDESNQGQK